MFEVKVDLKVNIKGCPKSGIKAFDFRNAHRLFPGTDNVIHLRESVKNEALCRRYSEYLDRNCDLFVTSDIMDRASFGILNYRKCFHMPEIHPNLLRVRNEILSEITLDAILAEVKRIHDLESKEEEEQKLKEAEKVKKEAETQSQCMQWVHAFGSELLKERLDGGFEWIGLFEQEYADLLCRDLGERIEIDEDHSFGDRTTPDLKEMKWLKQVKQSFEGKPVEIGLVWNGSSELKAVVTCPTGRKITRFYSGKL